MLGVWGLSMRLMNEQVNEGVIGGLLVDFGDKTSEHKAQETGRTV
jgi:hypothetical protein